MHAANPRTVLVVSSSYPYAIELGAGAPARRCCGRRTAGRSTAHALADVLFGDADPGGRLTQTWYRRAADLPDLLDYDIIGADATYLYYRGEPLYPFGHGLTYAPFDYADLRVSDRRVRRRRRSR